MDLHAPRPVYWRIARTLACIGALGGLIWFNISPRSHLGKMGGGPGWPFDTYNAPVLGWVENVAFGAVLLLGFWYILYRLSKAFGDSYLALHIRLSTLAGCTLCAGLLLWANLTPRNVHLDGYPDDAVPDAYGWPFPAQWTEAPDLNTRGVFVPLTLRASHFGAGHILDAVVCVALVLLLGFALERVQAYNSSGKSPSKPA